MSIILCTTPSSLSQSFLVSRVLFFLLHLEVFKSHLNPLRSLLQAAAVMMCDGPLVVLRGVYVIRDSRVLVAAVVVAAHLLGGVIQELPGEQRLHLKRHESQRKDAQHPKA